jgi:hypothetical protein
MLFAEAIDSTSSHYAGFLRLRSAWWHVAPGEKREKNQDMYLHSSIPNYSLSRLLILVKSLFGKCVNVPRGMSQCGGRSPDFSGPSTKSKWAV